MRVRVDGTASLDVTYCLNIHPGETWEDQAAAIRLHVPEVRRRLGRDGESFGLGLRLGAVAVAGLGDPAARRAFAAALAEENLYAFTINGFPYGTFHGQAVKEQVYRPDWRTRDRVVYTCALVDLLAEWLPEDRSGSISTLPGSYRSWIDDERGYGAVVSHLAEVAWHCRCVEEETGRCIRIAIEPEPDCLWDCTDDMVRLFETDVVRWGVARLVEREGVTRGCAEAILRRHLGVCFDTCHLASRFESVSASLRRLLAADIAVPKVQLSAAPLAVRNTASSRGALAAFQDEVYLHQAALRTPEGAIHRFADLPDLLLGAPEFDEACELRTHCHVPLCWSGAEFLASTRTMLDAGWFRLLCEGGAPHVEVETYTFDVLPASVRDRGVDESVAAELSWVLARLAGGRAVRRGV